MRVTPYVSAVIAAAGLLILHAAQDKGSATRKMSMEELRDRIEGGWAGQMIGVSFGAPTEFRYKEQMIEGALPEWKPDRISNSINQDDLYVDMTFAQVLDDQGIEATTEDFGAMFREAKYALWHANLAARRALKRGVPASLSGTPKYNAHANDIDFQIEADFIGLMAPGMPNSATEIAWRAGRVMNHGDGIYGGIFVSCMYAAAFVEPDVRKVVEAGLACLPAKSPYAQTIADTMAWSKQHSDWKQTWRELERKWNNREPCPDGALQPFNIDARLNGAYIALGLLYGGGDFFRTMEISTRAGQDSDCNPSSACGILGVMMGYKRIPNEWKSGIPAISKEKFRYTNYTFPEIVESTRKRAVALAVKNGGKLDGDALVFPVQRSRPTKLEMWDDYGSPAERVAASDARWQWKGPWKAGGKGRMATDKGAEVAIDFNGTGAIVVGPYLPEGGKADVYLDGKMHSTVDVYPDENSRKGGESVWHAFGLRNGKHSLRLVVRGEPYGDSKGTAIAVEDLVVFR